MNANAKKWLAALRSGEFPQTQGHLRDHKGYCCLGVACEVYRRETGRGRWDEKLSQDMRYLKFNVPPEAECGRMGFGTALPNEVKNWLGLADRAGSYQPEGTLMPSSLAMQNDNGASFEQIAKLVETEPPLLFVKEE